MPLQLGQSWKMKVCCRCVFFFVVFFLRMVSFWLDYMIMFFCLSFFGRSLVFFYWGNNCLDLFKAKGELVN